MVMFFATLILDPYGIGELLWSWMAMPSSPLNPEIMCVLCVYEVWLFKKHSSGVSRH